MIGQDKPLIIHVTADHPDTVDAGKTRVVQTLVDLIASNFHNRVISINRIEPSLGRTFTLRPRLEVQELESGNIATWLYHAPGRGIWHRTMLIQLGERIYDALAAGPKPRLIIGHKLTVEGIAVAHAAKRLGIPYALSIQGDTDTRILSIRRDLKREFARIWHGAAVAFPFSIWSQRAVEKVLGTRSGPTVLLPCPTDIDQPLAPRPGNGSLISAFHLKNWRRKNLAAMSRAVAISQQQGATLSLEVVGGGSAQNMDAARAIISDTPGISLLGPLSHAELPRHLNHASGFVLPSKRESFGLVFIEALFAGLPIIYPRGQAVDGFFDGCEFALPVHAHDPGEIALAMRQVIANEAAMKDALASWQQSEHAHSFGRAAIGKKFRSAIRQAVA